jgi:hypothetical protein
MTSHEIAAAAADLATVEALRARVRALEAESRQWRADAYWWHATVANYVTSATVEDREMLRDAMAEATRYPHPGAALLAELEAARALKNALDEIDHEPVGAYEVTWSSIPEPCEACVEVREIAARALAAYDRTTNAT